MKICFLGTGAADWVLKKEEVGEKRRFSSALIDDILLIDPGPHVLDALQEYGKNICDIKYIINTHKHSDHYNEDVLKALTEAGAEFFDMSAGEAVKLGKYTVEAFFANHSTCKSGAVHFIISDGVSNLFYGLDSAWLMYEEITAIKSRKIQFAVLDGTIGNAEGDYRIFEHNNLRMVREIYLSLKNSIERCCISHMAYTLHESHEKLSAEMAAYNIEVAFDGWETEF